jgi:hypothetical protein
MPNALTMDIRALSRSHLDPDALCRFEYCRNKGECGFTPPEAAVLLTQLVLITAGGDHSFSRIAAFGQ